MNFTENELFFGYFWIYKVLNTNFRATEAVAWRYSIKNVLLKILQNSREKTSARASFKKKLQHGCFPENFRNFSRTLKMAASGPTILQNNSQ